MRIDILSLFPEMFIPIIGSSILKRAQEKALVEINLHQIRDYAYDKHRVVDDYPFGGGAGMVLKVEPVVLAVEDVIAQAKREGYDGSRVILLTPGGRVFKQELASELACTPHLVLICGHYEGVDERVVQLVVDEELSIGDYVLTGGEIPAMAIMDSVVRLLPGVLGSDHSSVEESFSAEGLLEYPQYTRPREFRNLPVPEVLLSGNHKDISRWRRGKALYRTMQRRPELLEALEVNEEDRECLESIATGKEVLSWKSSKTLK